MAHGVHCVVRFMAVKGPVALLIGFEFKLTHLTHSNVLGDLVSAGRFWSGSTICTGDQEFMAV